MWVKNARGTPVLLTRTSFKAKDLAFKAKAKDSKFVLEDSSRPRTTTLGHTVPPVTQYVN